MSGMPGSSSPSRFSPGMTGERPLRIRGSPGDVVPRRAARRPWRCSAGCLDAAEEPVRLVLGPGREVERTAGAGRAVVAERQAPESVDLQDLAVGSLEDTVVLPVSVRTLLVGVDLPV